MKRIKQATLCALLTVLLVLAACAPTADTPVPAPAAAKTVPAPAATTSGAAAPTTAAQPKKGGTLNVGLDVDPATLDPRNRLNTSDRRMQDLIYSGLVSVDAQLNVSGDAAEKWDVSDPLTYIFTLRKGVKFHDGTELTSDDVKYTYDTILSDKTYAANLQFYAPIKTVEAVDKYTVKFTLKQPFAPLLVYLDNGIVPRHVGEQPNPNVAEHPIGSGPFKFVSWEKRNKIVLDAFDDYYKGRPFVDHVVIFSIPDNGVRVVGLESGNLDLTHSPLNGPDAARLATNKDITEQKTTALGWTSLQFNLKRPILADKRVRQAIAFMVNKETISKDIFAGMDTPGISPLIPNTWFYSEAGVEKYAYNPDKAKALLADAGYKDKNAQGILLKDGQPLKLNFWTNNDPNRQQILEFMQNNLKSIGMDASVTITEFPAFSDALNAGNYDVGLVGLLSIKDPDYAMYTSFYSKVTTTGYARPDVDALLDKGRTTLDQAQRKQIYADAARIVVDDAPRIWVLYQGYVVLFRNYVKGFQLNPLGSFKSFEKVWLDK